MIKPHTIGLGTYRGARGLLKALLQPVIMSLLSAAGASARAATNAAEPVQAAADHLRVDKGWLDSTLLPLLAALALFMMLVLGMRLVQATGGREEEILLLREKDPRQRFWNFTRSLGGEFWVALGIGLLMLALRFHGLLFLSLAILYGAAKLGWLVLRERAGLWELARQERNRTDSVKEQLSEIDAFFEQLKVSSTAVPAAQEEPAPAAPMRVEVRSRPTLNSEKFLSSCIQQNCYFRSLSAARRAPLAAELERKLHLRWKEFEIREDSLYLNRQDASGGWDQVCVLALHPQPGQAPALRVNAGFLQWALGAMVGKNDLVYETEDGYRAPDETERAQLALLPESRRPNLLPVREIVNPWHAMIG
jgi:hypothetical protein